MSTNAPCTRCKSPLPPGSFLGDCPTCQLQGALDPPGCDDYELLEELGRGGMGVIYRARQGSRIVALKMIRGAEFSGAAERQRFRQEIEAVSKLDHPNIVPIFHVGETREQGLPYFTMKLMEGGPLSRAVEGLRGDGRRTASLVAAIARGVHHAHQRGILHRDLKPANVLLDSSGVPHVADFGMAKLLDADSSLTQPGILGTPGYMAPEQAGGDPRRITIASDVYSLGAILFELLSGRPPFEGNSVADVLQRMQTEEPPRPRALDPRVARDLETVCLKCLEKDPARRYRSAEELAEDLDRFARNEPILARPIGVTARLWRVCRRHPLAAAASAGVVLLALGVGGAAIQVAHAQETALRQGVLNANVFAARYVAGAVLLQLSRFADRLERIAGADELRGLSLDDSECLTREDALLPFFARVAADQGFDSISLLDRSGRVVVRWPKPPRHHLCSDYSWRDYFDGARRLGEKGRRAVHVSRAFNSELDEQFKFALSTPIYAADGRWIGVMRVAIGTDSTMGPLRLRDPADPRRLGVLVGLRDNERDEAGRPRPDENVVLLHEAMAHGANMPIASGPIREVQAALAARASGDVDEFLMPPPELSRAVEDHRDPVPGFEGRWLAGVAPVGGTRYVVVLQTLDAAALEPGQTLWKLLQWGGGALAAFALALWVVRRVTRPEKGPRKADIRGQ